MRNRQLQIDCHRSHRTGGAGGRRLSSRVSGPGAFPRTGAHSQAPRHSRLASL